MLHLIEVVVKVAIIGSGISGIGSSRELTKNGVEHIVIEARNRTGGRVTSTVFNGVTVQLGAELVHQTKEENPIAKILERINGSSTGHCCSPICHSINMVVYNSNKQISNKPKWLRQISLIRSRRN